ncbi:MAG: hypothetical protein ACI976_000177 [Aureispira sp.]|jgi:hypothetical protein
MEELKVLDDVKLTKKIYSQKGITLGAFLGGPVTAGYLLIENYKSVENRAVVNKAWGVTIFSTIIYYVLAYFLKEVMDMSTVPLFVGCVVGSSQIFKQLQAEDVEAYIQKGGEIHSNWRVAGIGLLFLLATIVVLGAGLMLYKTEEPIVIPPPQELIRPTIPARSTTSSSGNLMKSEVNSLQSKSYGDAAHVIVYNDFFFSELRIDTIAEQLTTLGFFDDNPKNIYLEKVLFDYEFSITDASADLTNEKTSLKYEQLRADMEAFLKDGKVRILLMGDGLEEVLADFGEEI